MQGFGYPPPSPCPFSRLFLGSRWTSAVPPGFSKISEGMVRFLPRECERYLKAMHASRRSERIPEVKPMSTSAACSQLFCRSMEKSCRRRTCHGEWHIRKVLACAIRTWYHVPVNVAPGQPGLDPWLARDQEEPPHVSRICPPVVCCCHISSSNMWLAH